MVWKVRLWSVRCDCGLLGGIVVCEVLLWSVRCDCCLLYVIVVWEVLLWSVRCDCGENRDVSLVVITCCFTNRSLSLNILVRLNENHDWSAYLCMVYLAFIRV